MSDAEDDDYSSDESSGNEEEQNKAIKQNGKPMGVLTLEDNEDDSKLFQRPDVTDMYEDAGEDEDDDPDDEMIGEDEDMDVVVTRKKKKQPNLSSSSSSNNNKLLAARTNLASRADSDSDAKKNQKKKKKKVIGICVVATKYDCVRRVGRKLGFKEVEEHEDWMLFWTDTSVSIDRVNQMKKWQKINHYPGMSEICRKDFLTRNMNRMMKLFPKEYSFYPKAWCLPADYADLANYARLKKNKTYICKPDSGCQGKGIFITKTPYKDIKPGDNYVAQVYISRPFTIDGFKFDLRVYVAVTSCDPFRIFVYKEGLARFTTEPYEEPTQSNCKDVFMHLTNYAIQKRSEEFIRDEETGTKRRISTINKWLREHGYDVDKLWADIDDVIIKVILSAHAVLKHNYRTCFANHYKGSACFEILGYDILFDRKMKPYVLEVNHSPSFTTDSKLDREIKDALIYDTIMLMNIGALDKKKCVEEERKRVRERLFLKQGKKETKEELDDILQDWLKHIERWEDKHMGNFRRVYPGPGTEKYDKFYNNTGTLFSETAASRARIEQAKQQMDEIARKNEKFLGNKTQSSGPGQSGSNRFLNKESRGESPLRKFSNNQSFSNSTMGQKNNLSSLNSANNLLNGNASANGTNNMSSAVSVPATPANVKINMNKLYQNVQQQTQSQQQTQLMPHRTNSGIKTSHPTYYQQMNSTGNGITKQIIVLPSAAQAPLETWKPVEINDLDEMERVQGLKQRENLLKGMGITDFVNKMLFGTSGTIAAVPASFLNNNTNSNNNNNHMNHQASNHFNNINELTGRNLSNNKLEIKTRNYNPFENNTLFSEKFTSNQFNRNHGNFANGKQSKLSMQNINNTFLVNNIYTNSNSTNNSNNNRSNNKNDFNNTASLATGQYRYQLSLLNNEIDNNSNQRINESAKTNGNDSLKKTFSNRLPIDLYKNDSSISTIADIKPTNANNTTTSTSNQKAMLNNYRIKSAQTMAKQRSSGLYIFSYHAPRAVPE